MISYMMIKGIINERCLRTSSMHMWQFKNGWVTHLIVRSGKWSEAEITIIKDCAQDITLLKLTTDGHKASRGLSATAELLVIYCTQTECSYTLCPKKYTPW